MRIKKSMIYKRIFGVYMIMVIFLISSLDIYIIKKQLTNIKKNSLYINQEIAYDVNEEINNINNSTNLIVKNMYDDKYIINDVIDFLDVDGITYLKRKLDKFSSSNEYFYKGIEKFTKDSFNMNDALINISFISYSRDEESSFNRRNQIKVKENKRDYLGEEYNFSNIVCQKNSIRYIREIREPTTLKAKGEIICTYDLSKIRKIISTYEKKYEVMILDDNENVVYDSNDDYEYEKYSYFSKVMEAKEEVQLDKNYYITKAVNASALVTIVKTQEVKMRNLPKEFFSSLFFIDILLFIIVEGVLYIKLKKLSDRTDTLLLAMERVKNGELNIPIPITNENDEINYISQNFNDMCKKLNEHIEKSYLAELNQKSAEMVALQNQINPHFLYNTLESIRMKAICNGDKEVGKMLYILAFLFRRQLKEKNIITIRSELEYCEKYLEIFKFRYDEKFEYTINCDEQLLNKEIIKFTIQPLIENYFVHGIRLENDNNKLSIEIRIENKDIVIWINDNGAGIDEEKIKSINEMLKTRINFGESIGLLNAHERIVIKYGKDYGIKLINNKNKGVMVVIKIPCKEVDKDV
ncbi:sensor histidine kinase [Clostridium gasigenes]|uniref:Two-component system, sensor histidine kinase YesM n=1 Tax=Clostridium gasigenes TaxID=94869 RepID=A0A1H0PZB4_9CLOT|nr:histidine kinase [Clostridium gasigenes]MBB6623221.1 histidine kinase [Clostridium gasigenes]MBU3088152.1 histidine kinase [Clostridium gasigenes]MBU3133810.1 histidine kinase [Clostridium gasigenes]SDP10492.1 two-component system, sensor histidine kinase YesM [Clostridium gasigenes]